VSTKDDIPHDFPHKHGATRTWIVDGDTRYKVICTFCRKLMGIWQYTKAEETKVYPEDIDAKYSTEQKKNWK